MSRPSSAGSYLQVKWWAFSHWKGDCARWREAHHFFETGNEWSASYQGEKETRGRRASLLAQFILSLSFTRTLYTCKLKETAEFLDRCSVGKKEEKNYDAFCLFCQGLTRLHFMISGNCVRSSNNLVLSPSLSQTKVDGLINWNYYSLYYIECFVSPSLNSQNQFTIATLTMERGGLTANLLVVSSLFFKTRLGA